MSQEILLCLTELAHTSQKIGRKLWTMEDSLMSTIACLEKLLNMQFHRIGCGNVDAANKTLEKI